MCDSERPSPLESAEILELADVLSRVGIWLGQEEYTICYYQFRYGSFAEQVYRVFDTRKAIYTGSQKLIATLPTRFRKRVKDKGFPKVGLEQQAYNTKAARQALVESGEEYVSFDTKRPLR